MTDPDLIASIDQATAEMTTKAKLYSAYFRSLTEDGLTRPEALDLTISLQETYEKRDADE